jgi:hypothetical protein
MIKEKIRVKLNFKFMKEREFFYYNQPKTRESKILFWLKVITALTLVTQATISVVSYVN